MTRLRLIHGAAPLVLLMACSNSSSTNHDAGYGTGGTHLGQDAGLGGRGGSGGTSSGGGTSGAGGIFGGGGTTARGGTGGTAGVGAGGATGAIDAGPTDGGTVDAAAPDVGVADAPLASDTADTARTEAGPAPVCGPFANGGAPPIDAGTTSPLMSFFVSSFTSVTGNLGGLAGADQRCQMLAAAVGVPGADWRAYLSAEHDPRLSGPSVNARDRIGTGPWYNARGQLVAADLASLHARTGDAAVFLDEHGDLINGNWTGSPQPVEHDVLTGSNPDGTVAFGKTCADWTSDEGPPDGGVPDGGAGLVARVGHSDGLGPMCNVSTSPIDYTSWNSSHDNAGCNNTLPLGGAGRIYCFKTNR